MLIRGGHILDPVNQTDLYADIRIKGDRISRIGLNLCASEKEDVIEADGLVVAPGLIDTHVHFRDPGQTWKEDLTTGAAAAAAGGFTTVVCMANTVPPVDTPDTLEDILQRGRETDIRILQISALTKGLKGKELVDMRAMAEHGASGFSDDGIPLLDEALLREAMVTAKELSLPISLHEEHPSFVHGAGVNKGLISARIGYGGAEGLAEEVMTARDCMLALATGAKVCIQHVSSAKSVEIIRHAKKMGADIHGEATPHHFTLTEEAVLQYGTNARMNPPLRTEEDRLAIIEGICDNTLDVIVTDHAPHCREEKNKPLAQAPSGIIGLETSLALGIKALVRPGHLTLLQLLERMVKGPCSLYGLPCKGIKEGAFAELVIFDEKQLWRADHFHSKSCNSPFMGWELPGKIRATVCHGKIAYKEELL